MFKSTTINNITGNSLDDNVSLVQQGTFQFYDELYNKTCAYYSVHILVKTRQYDSGIEYFDIGYKYKFYSEDLKEPDDILHFRKVLHPFYQENPESRSGEIVKKNRMTSTLVEYLLMPDDILASEIGMTTPQRYRQDIMTSLSKFWD
jgi:hypothetical protein